MEDDNNTASKLMNDEIKEILDYLKFAKDNEDYEYALFHKEAKLLLDYITNLQQENEELKSQIEYANKINNEAINRKNKYKSRIEKAVEMINKYELIIGYYDYVDEDGYWDTDRNNNLQEELKDTLNGKE